MHKTEPVHDKYLQRNKLQQFHNSSKQPLQSSERKKHDNKTKQSSNSNSSHPHQNAKPHCPFSQSSSQMKWAWPLVFQTTASAPHNKPRTRTSALRFIIFANVSTQENTGFVLSQHVSRILNSVSKTVANDEINNIRVYKYDNKISFHSYFLFSFSFFCWPTRKRNMMSPQSTQMHTQAHNKTYRRESNGSLLKSI